LVRILSQAELQERWRWCVFCTSVCALSWCLSVLVVRPSVHLRLTPKVPPSQSPPACAPLPRRRRRRQRRPHGEGGHGGRADRQDQTRPDKRRTKQKGRGCKRTCNAGEGRAVKHAAQRLHQRPPGSAHCARRSPTLPQAHRATPVGTARMLSRPAWQTKPRTRNAAGGLTPLCVVLCAGLVCAGTVAVT